MTQLTPYFYQQFFDLNGNPLAGGKIFSYAAGTSTPQATYIDSTGGTANTNPIILDSSGRGQIWLGTLGYKFVITDSADVVLATVDNVSYINPGSIVQAMIANGAVGSAQIADGAVITSKIGDKQVTAAKIADGTITTTQIAAATILGSNIAPGTLTPSLFSTDFVGFSLSAAFVTFRTFTVISATATVGATYTNNGFTFTVLATIAGATTLKMSGTGSPTIGATTLTLSSGSGDATISVTSSTGGGTYNWTVPPGRTRVFFETVGGGGGGGGSNASPKTSGNGGQGCIKVQGWINDLTPGSNIPISVGLGGAGGTVNSQGSQGGSTLFNSKLLCLGGLGGSLGGNFSNAIGGGLYTTGGISSGATGPGGPGQQSEIYPGGVGGVNGGGGGFGGAGGGSGSFGVGGTGGRGDSTFVGVPATGSGAGGGGAGTDGASQQAGGAGSDGLINIYY